ncbi:MAG: nucleoside deaminase [Clostridia bacterium]|nr:nucleoside deaminase [Clostridia bacterium]
MELALEEARKALSRGEVPVGAVLMHDGQVIASAGNEREASCDPTAHAEILCLQRGARKLGRWHLEDCQLYVTLEPCPMCAGALGLARLGHVVYGAPDIQKGCCGSVYDLLYDRKLRTCTSWQGGEMEQACRALLDGFFAMRRQGIRRESSQEADS